MAISHLLQRFDGSRVRFRTPALRDAERIMRSLWEAGVATSVDLLGEATVTAPEADRYAARCAAASSSRGARSLRSSGAFRAPALTRSSRMAESRLIADR